MDQGSPMKPDQSIEFTPSTPVNDTTNDQKRRRYARRLIVLHTVFIINCICFYFCSSQRSIKRKRFDDEIVTYSLGIQPGQVNRVGRARRQSQTFVVGSPSSVSTTTAVNTPSQVVSGSVPIETVVAPSTPQLTSAIELPIEEPKTVVSKLSKILELDR